MANWNKLCRACLTTKESFTYFLFDNVSSEVYGYCTSVEVFQDEELPKALCNACYDLLTKLSEFKRTCVQSQNTLLNLNKDVKCETVLATAADTVTNDIKNNCDTTKIEMSDVAVKAEDVSDHFNDDELEFGDQTVLDSKIKVQKRITKYNKLKQQCPKPKVKLEVTRKRFIFTCDVCNKKFNYQERFEAHKMQHEGKIVSINCKPCNKTFMTWSGLKRHNESEHTLVNLESLKCSTCGKICKSRQTLKMHQKTHGERRLCICDVCGKGFTTSVILRAHLETHKENRERRFTCEHCGKKYFTNTILLSHVSRRHKGRRYICQLCSYPFTDKYNLAKHLLTHDGKKLHKCDICDKSYATQSSLVEHKRIHSGERPFVCSYCPKSFLSKRRLNDHHRIHTGEKPHKCGVCDQGFTQRGTMKRHMKVHDKINPVIN